MTQFYPYPDHQGHQHIEHLLTENCKQANAIIVDCPQYYFLPQNQKELYARTFSENTLFIRSMPDKLIMSNPPVFVDMKATVRKDTGNIAIELSSFYFNLQRCKIGISSFFAYLLDNELRFFSPAIIRPSAIFIQSKWKTIAYPIFIKYAQEIKRHFETNFLYDIVIHDLETSGSGDPFVLLPIPTVGSLTLKQILKKSWEDVVP